LHCAGCFFTSFVTLRTKKNPLSFTGIRNRDILSELNASQPGRFLAMVRVYNDILPDILTIVCHRSFLGYDVSENFLGDFNTKVDREDIFKPTIGNESLHEISNDNGVE
jgi:hypothetical protein